MSLKTKPDGLMVNSRQAQFAQPAQKNLTGQNWAGSGWSNLVKPRQTKSNRFQEWMGRGPGRKLHKNAFFAGLPRPFALPDRAFLVCATRMFILGATATRGMARGS